MSRIVLNVISFLSGLAVFFLLVIMGPFVWLLRDGLGPDSTESTGWYVIQRMFWTFAWGPMTLLAVTVYAIACYVRRRSK